MRLIKTIRDYLLLIADTIMEMIFGLMDNTKQQFTFLFRVAVLIILFEVVWNVQAIHHHTHVIADEMGIDIADAFNNRANPYN